MRLQPGLEEASTVVNRRTWASTATGWRVWVGLHRLSPGERDGSPRTAAGPGPDGGPRTAVWAGGLDSRPRIEKVVGDAGAWLPQRRRRRLLVQVLEQRTGLSRRHSPPREGQRALESREPVASAARLGWHGGAVEAINLCRKASSSVRAAPGQACSPEQRPSMPESCSGCRARCWPSRGRRARLERRARLLAATLAFHPREGGHTMPRSSRWARPPCCVRGDGVLGLRVRSCTG